MEELGTVGEEGEILPPEEDEAERTTENLGIS